MLNSINEKGKELWNYIQTGKNGNGLSSLKIEPIRMGLKAQILKIKEKCSDSKVRWKGQFSDRAVVLAKGIRSFGLALPRRHHNMLSTFNCKSTFGKALNNNLILVRRNCSTSATSGSSSLEPPDVPRLAETARISLTPLEVCNFSSSLLIFVFLALIPIQISKSSFLIFIFR